MYRHGYSGTPILTQRILNELCRQGARLAVEFWLLNFMPLHFQPGARQRYGYLPRSAKWQAIKERARWIWNRARTARMPATQPPRDLVWRREVMVAVIDARTSAVQRIDARATANRIVAEVTVPLPHPMQARYVAEITITPPEEQRVLQAICDEHIGAAIPQAIATAPRTAA